MKTVTIPTCANPFVVIVNGIKYTYPAGATMEVPDDVAEVIEQHEEAKTEPAPVAPPFASVPSGGESGGTSGGGGLPVVELTTYLPSTREGVMFNETDQATLNSLDDSKIICVTMPESEENPLFVIPVTMNRVETEGMVGYIGTLDSYSLMILNIGGWTMMIAPMNLANRWG